MMNACELTATITTLANLIASHLDEDELALLIIAIALLKDTLTTISLHRAIAEKISPL